MAESVMTRLAAVLLSTALLSAAGSVFAHGNDPTKPPAAAQPTEQDEDVVPAGPQLQSVLITYGTPPRKVAVIDGAAVKIGDKVGAATVQSITAREVILRTGRTRQVLKLYADADAPATAAKPAHPHEKTQDQQQDKRQEKPQDK